MLAVQFNVKKVGLNLLVVCSFLLAALAFGDDTTTANKTANTPAVAEQGQLPLNDLRTFAQVYDEIRHAYVEEVDDKTLLKNAMIGMLTQLDPHSTYLDKSAFQELQTTTSGEFGGLGIEVEAEDGFIKVISPIDGTPAQRGGIKADDMIIKIDEAPVKGMLLDDAINKMHGDKGTPITLTIMREGADKPMVIKLVRDLIKVVSIRSRALEAGFVYARIAEFQVNTADDLKKALEKLKAENKGKIEGVVLDLRNNPGGVLQAAVDVADLFLEEGTIVSTKGRVPNSNMEYDATAGDILNHAPLVVLINEGSASASEIVAGALQDQKRAILLGTQTFGKGSVQTVIPISADQAIKLTTARYYTPKGRSIQAEGITPDIVVEPAVIESIKPDGFGIKEANLEGHLVNEKSSKTPPGSRAGSGGESELNEWLKKDNQLHDALNILKAVRIAQSNKTTGT